MKTFFRIAITAMALVGLIGCASPVYDGRFAWNDGWRSGVVESRAVARKDSFLLGPHCSVKSAALPTDSDVVTVKYSRMSRVTWWSGAVAKDSAIRPDDRVYFNIRDCTAGVIRADN